MVGVVRPQRDRCGGRALTPLGARSARRKPHDDARALSRAILQGAGLRLIAYPLAVERAAERLLGYPCPTIALQRSWMLAEGAFGQSPSVCSMSLSSASPCRPATAGKFQRVDRLALQPHGEFFALSE